MFKLARMAALSAVVGLGAIAAAPAPAHAGSGGIQFSSGSAVISVQFGQHRNVGFRHYRRAARPACNPRQAVRKAARMGLRNVRVTRANRNVIRVVGRSWRHGRTAIVFARTPRCPVIRTR